MPVVPLHGSIDRPLQEVFRVAVYLLGIAGKELYGTEIMLNLLIGKVSRAYRQLQQLFLHLAGQRPLTDVADLLHEKERRHGRDSQCKKDASHHKRHNLLSDGSSFFIFTVFFISQVHTLIRYMHLPPMCSISDSSP